MIKKYPSAEDVAEMRARGYDPTVIEEQMELSKRRELLEQVRLQISTAFADVRLGDGVGLYEAQALDDYASDEKQAACREKDEKVSWQKIPAGELDKCNSSLSFFDEEGMRFHLPAYLIAEINGDYSFDMAFCLTRCGSDKFALFNDAQIKAVLAYLRFIESEPDYEWDREHIRRAIEEYWAV